ncbi:MAG: ATP-binding protein [Candidatus Hatepunaea meridiana]|nr:ATP-binding protein [Candidatus Hatepunaea meridiana]
MIQENQISTDKFKNGLANISPVGIAYLSADGTVLHANPILLQMMQASNGNGNHNANGELKELLSVVVTEDNRSILDHLLDGETIQAKEVEYTLISGVKKQMNISGKPHFSLNGKVNGAVLMCSDLTDQNELQAQLQQAQKMEALGQLTSGVAHDFNNLLTVIIGNTELMLMSIESGNPLQSNVEGIMKAAESATNLTKRLLAFSRKQPIELSVMDLNNIINEMDLMLQCILRQHIKLVTTTEPNLWKIKANQGQIEQVIINLIVNARDAMPQGGTLSIETKNTRLNRDYAVGRPEVNPGKYILLTVTDTGCGMTEEVKAKVFQPFFTTKESEKGTGLGLSTVYTIVKQIGGYIWVYSEPGQGTTFQIYLPIAEEEICSFSYPMRKNEIPIKKRNYSGFIY